MLIQKIKIKKEKRPGHEVLFELYEVDGIFEVHTSDSEGDQLVEKFETHSAAKCAMLEDTVKFLSTRLEEGLQIEKTMKR